MAGTVTSLVPPTVKMAHVTYKMGPVLHAIPDGRGYCVKKVRRTMYIELNNGVFEKKLTVNPI